jgi:hypothetical protein
MTTPALVSMQGRLADSGSEGFREASTPRTTTVGATAARIAEPKPVPGSTAVWESEGTVANFEGGKGTKTAMAVPPSAAPLLLPEVSPIRVKPMTTATIISKAPDTSAGFDWRMPEHNTTRQVGPECRLESSEHFLHPPGYRSPRPQVA